MSSKDQALFLVVNPMPKATYTVDWPLNMLEKALDEIRAGIEELGGAFELNPDFQRGHVWTPGQRTAYAEAFIRTAVAGRILFNCPGWSTAYRGGDIPEQTFQCIDGLQRLTTMRMFLAGEVRVFGGLRAADLSGSPFDPTKLTYQLQIGIYEFSSRRELLDFYLRLNEGGTPHSAEELGRVRRMLHDARAGGCGGAVSDTTAVQKNGLSDKKQLFCAAPHALRSAGIDQVMNALKGGGHLSELAASFYSGGYSYTHVLTTKRGTQYRVSKQVLRGIPANATQSDPSP